MKKRVMSGAVIFLIIVLTIASRLITPYIFDAVILITAVSGVIEVCRAYANGKKSVSEVLASTMIFVLYIGIIYAIFNKGTLLNLLLYLLAIVAGYFVLSILITVFNKDNSTTEMLRNGFTGSFKKYVFIKALKTISVILYPTLLFALLIVINHFDSFFALTVTDESAIKSVAIFIDFIIISLFTCTTLTDTFAMLVGSAFKGPKLCPNISPNKTVSGAIGGWIFGAIGILGIYMLYSLHANFNTLINTLQITWLPVIIYACLAPVFTQLGDILASKIKRNNNIKDFSNLIPGHGGIMDRVDGLIMTSVVAFVVTIIACL